jgi:hypothetical protein
MTLSLSRRFKAAAAMAAALLLLPMGNAEAARPGGVIGKDWGDKAGLDCLKCHMTETPGLFAEWNDSKHGQNGVNCMDCHKAEKGDKDAYMHEEQ